MVMTEQSNEASVTSEGASHGVGQKSTTAPPCLHLCGFYHLGANEDGHVPLVGFAVGLNINAFVILIDL